MHRLWTFTLKLRLTKVYCRIFLTWSSKVAHRRAIKEENKVASRDWFVHQAFSLLQYINGIANLYKMELF